MILMVIPILFRLLTCNIAYETKQNIKYPQRAILNRNYVDLEGPELKAILGTWSYCLCYTCLFDLL